MSHFKVTLNQFCWYQSQKGLNFLLPYRSIVVYASYGEQEDYLIRNLLVLYFLNKNLEDYLSFLISICWLSLERASPLVADKMALARLFFGWLQCHFAQKKQGWSTSAMSFGITTFLSPSATIFPTLRRLCGKFVRCQSRCSMWHQEWHCQNLASNLALKLPFLMPNFCFGMAFGTRVDLWDYLKALS